MEIPPPGIQAELSPGTSSGDLLASLPESPGALLVSATGGAALIICTANLRKRLSRLVGARKEASRSLSLHETACRLEVWHTGNRLEASLIAYNLARRHFPADYRSRLRVRAPVFLKLALGTRFPRTLLTRTLGGERSLCYGPFPTRRAASQFQQSLLDLFQLRRCPDRLNPSPEHPGCIYGEMNKCLRPCQMAVTEQEYASEVERVAAFLRSQGESLLRTVAAARDRLSQELEFEEAARQHTRYERVLETVGLRGDLAAELNALCGLIVLPAATPEAVTLLFLQRGGFLPPQRFPVHADSEQAVSLDHRLRSLSAELPAPPNSLRDRLDHLSLLTAWYYSRHRDGEWIAGDPGSSLSYRRAVRAISRVATRSGIR